MAIKTRRALSVAALSLFAVFTTTLLTCRRTPGNRDGPSLQASGKLTFARLYTSADGNSHFRDEAIDLKPIGTGGIEGRLAEAAASET